MNNMRALADAYHLERAKRDVSKAMRDLPKRIEEQASMGYYDLKVMELTYERDYDVGFWSTIWGLYRLRGPAKDLFDMLKEDGYNVKVVKPYSGAPWLVIEW